jgi:hypothetical protein
MLGSATQPTQKPSIVRENSNAVASASMFNYYS